MKEFGQRAMADLRGGAILDNDVTDINGFSSVNPIIVHMTVHFLQWCVDGTDIHKYL